jgi:predicted kinase
LVVIVTGPPGSGKTTLGRELTRRLSLPFLTKDLFKEVLFDELGWSDREWSRRLGRAATAMLFHTAGVLLRAGQSVALESNFYAEWDTPPLRGLAETYGCWFVQVVCSASDPTLVARYQQRIASGERHRGHTESEDVDDTLARILNGQWDALELAGPVVRVSTETDTPAAVVDVVEREVRRHIDVQVANPWHAQRATSCATSPHRTRATPAICPVPCAIGGVFQDMWHVEGGLESGDGLV